VDGIDPGSCLVTGFSSPINDAELSGFANTVSVEVGNVISFITCTLLQV
jgi:hypothetical protein